METENFSRAENTLYRDHLNHLKQIWSQALHDNQFDAVIIAAGSAHQQFLDDATMPFRPNPHFAWWLPEDQVQESYLVYTVKGDCEMYFFQPSDFWHAPPNAPTWIEPDITLRVFDDLGNSRGAIKQLLKNCNSVAFIGEHEELAIGSSEYNPAQLLAALHFDRAVKTAFEANCMKMASEQAVLGHLAAEKAFRSGESEFVINHQFLGASKQAAEDLPYHSIVALNEHASVLHYQHYDYSVLGEPRSFLIDAGARYKNYCSDITRTYAAKPGDFSDLIEALDIAQQRLSEQLKPGKSYVDYHQQMAMDIAKILVAANVVTCSPESAFDSGITETFFPHGLGHLLGLQTHDIGGQQTSRQGGVTLPPERFSALRMTRTIEPGFIFTVEPGIYFIPMLLEKLKVSSLSSEVNWPLIDALLPFGGIRIEDDVMVTKDSVINFTREAFSQYG